MDCGRLPDGCDWVVDHLLEDREYQKLDGKFHGVWRDYYKNGVLRFEGNYVYGVCFGIWYWWNKDGDLLDECIYEDGDVRREW